eukprot:137166_1
MCSINDEQLNSLNEFNIFGYPNLRPEKYKSLGIGGMFGMESAGNNYCIDLHARTERQYLKQRAVDTSAGQSGSCIWYKDKISGTNVIFGVHCGGHLQRKNETEPSYNVAT